MTQLHDSSWRGSQTDFSRRCSGEVLALSTDKGKACAELLAFCAGGPTKHDPSTRPGALSLDD
jgi:hypothetical protein